MGIIGTNQSQQIKLLAGFDITPKENIFRLEPIQSGTESLGMAQIIKPPKAAGINEKFENNLQEQIGKNLIECFNLNGLKRQQIYYKSASTLMLSAAGDLDHVNLLESGYSPNDISNCVTLLEWVGASDHGTGAGRNFGYTLNTVFLRLEVTPIDCEGWFQGCRLDSSDEIPVSYMHMNELYVRQFHAPNYYFENSEKLLKNVNVHKVLYRSFGEVIKQKDQYPDLDSVLCRSICERKMQYLERRRPQLLMEINKLKQQNPTLL